MAHMQQVLELEKAQSMAKDKLAERRTKLDSEIERLASPGGSNDPRLKGLADTLGGVLLSEIYDDITIDDAPYFSAMYGPARHAIVVSDLSGIKEKLVELDDCPEDLYLIEGDVDAFDDSSFNAEELEGAVCVQLNQRQMRYSRFPAIPLFGRAAREQRLELLREERDDVVEQHAKASFDSQKLQRLYASFNQLWRCICKWRLMLTLNKPWRLRAISVINCCAPSANLKRKSSNCVASCKRASKR